MSELDLLQRLNNFRKEVKSVEKDKTNPHFKSKYATIESVIDTIEIPLNNCGLGYYQNIVKLESADYLQTTIFNLDNTKEILINNIPLFCSNDMQKLGSAITYARRYGLVTILGLKQEDDDGNIAAEKETEKSSKNRAESKKLILTLNSKYPFPKDNIGNTWGEAIITDLGRSKIDSYISYKLKNHNVVVELDEEFTEVLNDVSVGF